MAHEIELEYTDARLTKREEVWYHRRRAAWRLAAKLGDVTQASYDAAWRLLNSCKNIALGFYNCDQDENEFNWRQIDAKRNRLINRMNRLNKRLEPYGCHITRAWCIENVYDWDFERGIPINDNGYLYFFD